MKTDTVNSNEKGPPRMDPITVTQLVHDRTVALQRIAEALRQERALRPASAETHNAAPTLAVEVPRAPAKAGGCSPAEPAV